MDPGQLTGAQRDELMEQVKQQIALANAQELLTVRVSSVTCVQVRLEVIGKFKTIFGLLQKMTEKCFKKCVSKPGTSLDSSEQVC